MPRLNRLIFEGQTSSVDYRYTVHNTHTTEVIPWNEVWTQRPIMCRAPSQP